MKKVLSVFLAFMMLCTSFAGVEIVYAADSTLVSSSAENAIELPCDSKWKSCSGSSSTVYYKITVADTGKLKLKIKTSSEIEAKLINQTGSITYYTVYSVASDSAKKTVKNQVISAGVYYLAVDCAGSYKLNATFGGNCYENPQKLKTETEVTGKKTTNEDGWWYKIKITKNTTYRFSAAAYGDLTVKIYNSDLSETVKTVTLSGSKKSPVKEKSNITLSKGKYYIKVTSNAKYKLSVCKLTKKNCDHIYVHENIKSTYTTKGYVKHTCTLCGYSYKDRYKALKTLSAPAVSVRAKSSSITVKCTRVYRATGYQIQYSTSSDFSSSAKIKTKDLTEKITSLSGSTKYYVRVRAYKTVGSKTVYSSWSAVQTARTK